MLWGVIAMSVVLMLVGTRKARPRLLADGATAAWRAAAEHFGAAVANAERQRSIVANVAGRKTWLRMHKGCTEVSTQLTAPAGFFLEVQPKLPSLSFEDRRNDILATGNPHFDAHYVVFSNDRTLMHYWLSEATQDLFSKLKGFRIRLEGGRLVAIRVGVVNTTQALVEAAEAVGQFADVARQLDRAWQQLARALQADKDTVAGRWQRVATQRLGLPFELHLHRVGRSFFSEMKTPLKGHPRSSFMMCDDGQGRGSFKERHPLPGASHLWLNEDDEIPYDAADLVELLDEQSVSSLMVGKHEALVRWRTALPSKEQVEAGAELLRRVLSSEQQGPYR